MNTGPRRFRCGPTFPRAAAVLAATALLVSGCGPSDAPAPAELAGAPEALPATRDLVTPPVGGVLFDAPEEAARQALELLAEGDAEGLSQLALQEADFREAVYPRLPAARPDRNTSAEFLWEMLHQRSRSSLATTLDRYRGRRYELIAVDFVGETTDYGPFQVHRDTVLTVSTPDGERAALRFFGSMLEQGGRYQIFSFVTD